MTESEWTKRLDRLLAGNINQQVGTALEALFERLGVLGERVEGLEGLRGQVERLLEALTDRYDADATRGLRESIESLGRSVAASAGPGATAAVQAGIDGLGSRLSALDRLAEQLAAVERRLSEGPEPLLEKQTAELSEHIEAANRKLGAAVGRLRIQVEGIEGRLAGIESGLREMRNRGPRPGGQRPGRTEHRPPRDHQPSQGPREQQRPRHEQQSQRQPQPTPQPEPAPQPEQAPQPEPAPQPDPAPQPEQAPQPEPAPPTD